MTLPYKKAVTASRLFYLDSPLVALRFDPLEQEGPFSVSQFEITAISDSQIEPALLARIQQEHQSYRNMELTKIKESISSESGSLSMDRLVSLYNETFTLPSLDYEEWIETVETPSLPDKGDVKVILETMQKPPLISVVMPVYNPEEVYLRACIDSVLEQSYPYWELW